MISREVYEKKSVNCLSVKTDIKYDTIIIFNVCFIQHALHMPGPENKANVAFTWAFTATKRPHVQVMLDETDPLNQI